MVKKLALLALGAAVFMLPALARADGIIATSYTGTTPFGLIALGSSAGAPAYVATGALGTFSGETITATGGAATGNPADPSGEYLGTISSVAETPFTPGGNTQNYYLAVQPGGSITITFATAQEDFNLLWGSVDPGPNTINDLVFNLSGTIITGAQILAADSAGGNEVVQLTGVGPFTTVTVTDPGATSAFEFVPGVPAPEAGTLGMLGAGLIGLIALGGFRRRSTVSC